MPTFIIQPGRDRRLRDEAGNLVTGPLPVDPSLYWTRRIAEGDAVAVSPEDERPAEPTVTRSAKKES